MYQQITKIEKNNKVTVEELYNLGRNDMGSTLAGHESVDCEYEVLNVKDDEDHLTSYYAPVKRVIRHKVSKPKWSLMDCVGNEVVVTNDHSLMVLRDCELQEVKPREVLDTDLIVYVKGDNVSTNQVKWCKQIGEFDDEYVYDIEMDDDTHTFVANDILVHNSIYASFYDIAHSTDWFEHPVWRLTKINKQNDQKEFEYVSSGGYPTEEDAKTYFNTNEIDVEKYDWHIDQIEPEGREFCLTLNRVFMSNFLKKIHEEYAEKQGTPNILDFELEAYNEAGIWLAKKKYIKNMTWAEPNVYYDSCTKIKPTGVEIAQTSSSPWVKSKLTELVKWIFQQEEFVLDSFINQLKKVKDAFMLQNPEIISVNKGMNKYNEYVLNDTDSIEMNPKAMVTVQGAALYNYIINNNEKFKRRYSTLFDADKLCVVYIKPTNRYTYWKKESQVLLKEYAKNPDAYKLISNAKTMAKGGEAYTDAMSLQHCEVFSYPAGMFPMDIAANFEIDYNRMFELLVLGPINRIIEAMGFQPVDINMTVESGLW